MHSCTHLVELGVQGTTVLHILHQVCPLTFIRSNDANLLWLDPGAQEAGHGFLHIRCLSPATVNGPESFITSWPAPTTHLAQQHITGHTMLIRKFSPHAKQSLLALTAHSVIDFKTPQLIINSEKTLMQKREELTMCLARTSGTSLYVPVEIGGSWAGDLFLTSGRVEEHWLVQLWPREVHVLLGAVTCHQDRQWSGSTRMRHWTVRPSSYSIHSPSPKSNLHPCKVDKWGR